MSNLVSKSYYDLISTPSSNVGEIVSSALSAVPTALAKPFLDYERVKTQGNIVMKAIDANQKTREDIMNTIRSLGMAGKLTPELSQRLFTAYNQALIQLPFYHLNILCLLLRRQRMFFLMRLFYYRHRQTFSICQHFAYTTYFTIS